MPKFDVDTQRFDDDRDEWVTDTATLNLPEKLPAPVGDTAEQMLDAEMEGKRNGDQVRATIEIGSEEFGNVREYLYTTMVREYNRGDDVDPEDLTEEGKDEVAGYYFDQLSLFDGSKKNGQD